MEPTGLRIITYPKKDQIFKLYDVADIHWVNAGCAKDHFRDDIKKIVSEDNALVAIPGDYCLPESAEALTKRGFVRGPDLRVDDLVLGYENGKTVWIPIEQRFFLPDSEFINISSNTFNATSTPNHRWLCKSKYNKRLIQYKTTATLNSNDIIVVAGECFEDGDLCLSADEAWMVGWVVTDGHIKKNISSPNARFNASISQSRKKYHKEIAERLKNYITGTYDQKDCDCSTFNLSVDMVEGALNKIHSSPFTIKNDLPGIVTRLNKPARGAIFDSMLKAEGWTEHTKTDGYPCLRIRFSQKPGPVLEAFKILATMEGYKIGKDCLAKNGVVTISISKTSTAWFSLMKRVSVGRGQAWCIKTSLGNFIAKIDGRITLTGNCDWISPSDPRFDAEAVDESLSIKDLTRLSAKISSGIIEELRPIASKCLGLGMGNHEWQYMKRRSEMQVHEIICQELGVPNLMYSSWMNLIFVHNPRAKRITMKRSETLPPQYENSLKIMTHHGKGAANTVGGKINSLRDIVDLAYDADIVMTGHLHEASVKPFVRIFTDFATTELKNRICFGMATGSYLRNYVPGTTSWAETRGFRLTTLGCVYVTYSPKLHAINDIKL